MLDGNRVSIGRAGGVRGARGRVDQFIGAADGKSERGVDGVSAVIPGFKTVVAGGTAGTGGSRRRRRFPGSDAAAGGGG